MRRVYKDGVEVGPCDMPLVENLDRCFREPVGIRFDRLSDLLLVRIDVLVDQPYWSRSSTFTKLPTRSMTSCASVTSPTVLSLSSRMLAEWSV